MAQQPPRTLPPETVKPGEPSLAGDPRRDAVKVILLGDSAAGKSKLIERYLMDDYHPQQNSTYAVTLFEFSTTVGDEKINVDFWDTAGQERFQSMHPSYYHRANACVLVFDVTRKETYQHLVTWYRELQEYRKGIPVICVANKIDMDYRVTQREFNFPTKLKLPFYFASASDGTNVVKVFDDAIRLALDNKRNPPDTYYDQVMKLIDDI